MLGISLGAAASVVIAAIGVYVAFLILVRVFGQRPLARMSTSDVVVVLAIGAVAGRAVLGESVTLAAGVIALLVLFVLRWLAEMAARTRVGRVLVRDRPVILMVENEIQRDHLRRFRVSEDEIWTVLRTTGIGNSHEVRCVVLEPTGAISVLRKGGAPLDRRMFAEAIGADRLPGRMFEAVQ